MEKKISFGFSKVVKKPQLIGKPNQTEKNEEEKIEIIECLEGQSIKIAGKVDDVPEAQLVIPLTVNTTPLEKVKQLREEAKAAAAEKKQQTVPENGSRTNETLDERAAREIMENLNEKNDEDNPETFTVPLNSDEIKLGGAKESSLDDYEDVPIANFGLAMLRGMGWKDEEHKQKQKSIEDDMIVCRPKGLGLGADKAMKQQVKLAASSGDTNEKLVMKKGAFVRILGGKQKDFYGQVEGMDDETGRVFVKMALGGNRESINEAFVQLVSEKEYKDNRKVLNMARYEEYKNKEAYGEKRTDNADNKRESSREESSSSSSRRREEGYHKKHNHRDRRSRSRSHEDRERDRERHRESSSSKHSRSRHDDRNERRRDRSRSRSRSRDRKYDRDSSYKKSHKDNDRRRRDR